MYFSATVKQPSWQVSPLWGFERRDSLNPLSRSDSYFGPFRRRQNGQVVSARGWILKGHKKLVQSSLQNTSLLCRRTSLKVVESFLLLISLSRLELSCLSQVADNNPASPELGPVDLLMFQFIPAPLATVPRVQTSTSFIRVLQTEG